MSKSTLYDIANEFEKSLDNLLDHDDSDLIKENCKIKRLSKN